jgi:peptidoglycan/LPS O-acetylase OafA/YrhL
MKGMRLLPLLVVVVMLMAVMTVITIHWQVLVSNLKTKSCFRNKVVQILNF